MAELNVQLVSADRRIWSGPASRVIARTTEGDIGVLPGHIPFLGLLGTGQVRILTTGDGEVVATVHQGFISVDRDLVSVIAEEAELAELSAGEEARNAEQLVRLQNEDLQRSRQVMRAESAAQREAVAKGLKQRKR